MQTLSAAAPVNIIYFFNYWALFFYNPRFVAVSNAFVYPLA